MFRLDADGCAGSGAITAAVNKAHIYMNCARVPNDLYFAGNYNTEAPTSAQRGDYPANGTLPLFPLVSSVSVEGSVFFNDNANFLPGTSKTSSSIVTFEKDVKTANKKCLNLYSYGKTVFNGKLLSGAKSSHAQIGGASTAKGAVEFNSSSNVLWSMKTYNANISFNAKDVFPGTIFYFMYGSDDRSIFDLNGNDQTIGSILWNIGNNRPSPSEKSSGLRFRTADGMPATVRLTGNDYAPDSNSSYWKNRVALSGPLTFVMDVADSLTAKGFFQEFALRESTTTGDLIISNGDFRVSGTASFPNVPNIYVGEGGSFTNASTKPSAFAGCTNLTVLGKMACTGDATPFGDATMALTLGSAAEFSMPEGTVLTVCTLNVGGVAMPDEVYGDGGISLAQIKSGTVVVRSGNLYVDCETGDDENDGIAARPFKTIKAATAIARKGYTIHVAPGTYGELEGARKYNDEATSLCRVIIPEGVTVESTDGAGNTFIVGAPAAGDVANGNGNGPGAVRCVYAHNRAELRGFTLTGGHTAADKASDDYDTYGAALLTGKDDWAYIHDCIISNNYSHYATIFQSNVSRCLIVDNTGGTSSGTTCDAPAGSGCAYINCIIDGNKGNGTVAYMSRAESCTFGKNLLHNDGTAQMLFRSSGSHRVLNSLFTYKSDRWHGTVCATNCIFASETKTNLSPENCENCLFGQSATKINVDADFRPKAGSIAIDTGDETYATYDYGAEKDIYGTPRTLNGKFDIGAVEYDWRTMFAAEVGKRISLTDVSPSVTTNAAGGILIPSGAVAGKVPSKGSYDFTFDVTGGTLEAAIGGEIVGTYADGTHTVRMNVLDPAAEFRFRFEPDAENPGMAIFKSVVSVRGLTISVR